MSNDSIDFASKNLWERAKTIYLSTLQTEEEKSQFSRYLSMISTVSRVGDDFIIYTSNSYASEFLTDNYRDKLKLSMNLASSAEEHNGSLNLIFKYDPSMTTQALVIPTPPKEAIKVPSSLAKVQSFSSTMPLNESYTFEEFVRGPSNSWALAAAQGIVANPGKAGYNPLFIHGGTGLGKTHLMQAIGNELRRKNPNMAVCYLTAETFLNEFINSLSGKSESSFRDKYRNIDVLLVDDVQFLQKGKQCQEEFFNTFNALQQAEKQIVMTCDVAPKNLPAIEQRLISRFEGGMVQEIESPNYETRLAILRKKSEGLRPSIPDNALQFIAETIKSHVRAMEGALRKVSMFRLMDPTIELTNDTLSRLLKDLIQKEISLKKLSIEEIQSSVAKKFSVTINQILSSERTSSLVTPRQLAMYIARKFTTRSLPEIAKYFEKTHATIIHGVKNIEGRLMVEPELKNTLQEILAEFGYSISDKME